MTVVMVPVNNDVQVWGPVFPNPLDPLHAPIPTKFCYFLPIPFSSMHSTSSLCGPVAQ